MNLSLSERIFNLIAMKQEGEYWDFKREWYVGGHEGDMLHDIICMANNLADRDAYIIIGVDEENDYKPFIFDKGNRKNTQQMVDFLRDKHFAGDFRPTVTVTQLIIGEYSLDVIIVHNSMNTPYYLTQSYKQVKEYHIYSRIQDTNTPISKSADIYNVEKLWRKRFGLSRTSLERVQLYLEKPEDWEECSYDESKKYYRFAPEFTIEYDLQDDESYKGYEYYMINQTDNTPHWTMLRVFYHQTIIKEYQGICLDGGRYFSPVPDRSGFSLKGGFSWDVSYSFFEEDSLRYALNLFYYDENNTEARISRNFLLERVLIFRNEYERKNFVEYAIANWNKKEFYMGKLDNPYIPDIPGYKKDAFKEETINALVLKEMLEDFRKDE